MTGSSIYGIIEIYRISISKVNLLTLGGKAMEKKIYEMLGIRQWKKFLLWIMLKIVRNPNNFRHMSNYYLESYNINAVRNFKKMLWVNGLIHTLGIILGILSMIKNGVSITMIIFLLINIYCLMLQRYNWIRIKKVLSRIARK